MSNRATTDVQRLLSSVKVFHRGQLHKTFYLTLQFLTIYCSIFTSEFETKLRSFINTSMECDLIPGMALTVVKGDDVWSRGYGTADLSTGRTVDEHTAFNVASITKSFTATLLGILLNETGHTWSSKVTDILGPEYGFVDDYRNKHLMIRDLLSHNSGLASVNDALVAGFTENISRAELCNYHPYEPAMAIMTTASDMAKWLKFNLKKGKTETGDQLIDKKLIEDMHWPESTYDSPKALGDRYLTKPQYPVDEIQIGYGYGWAISTYRGYKMIWHRGRSLSYGTMFAFYPDKDIGMFASVNGPALKTLQLQHITTLLYYISDNQLGLEPWLNQTTACTFPEPWANKPDTTSKEPEVPITVENQTEYTGEFSNPLFHGVEVSTNSTTMFIKAKPRLSGILQPSSEKDRFLWQITDPWDVALQYKTRVITITFLRDESGDIKAFKALFDVELTFTKNGYVNGAQHVTISVVYIVLAATLANIVV